MLCARTVPASRPAGPLSPESPPPASASPPHPGAASSAVQALPSKTCLFPQTSEMLIFSTVTAKRHRNSEIRKKLNTGISSFTSEATGLLSGAKGFLANDPMFSMLLFIISLAKGRGFRKGGVGGAGGTAGQAKALIVVIILVLIIPFIALLFSGATTGSTGLYGHATISYAGR